MTAETLFRWRSYNADLGMVWSDWHSLVDCDKCCCDGRTDGLHQEPTVYYDDPDDYVPVFSGHTVLNPNNPDPWDEVEWQSE